MANVALPYSYKRTVTFILTDLKKKMDLSGESNKIAKEPVEEIKILWPHHHNIIPKLSGQSYHISNHISER